MKFDIANEFFFNEFCFVEEICCYEICDDKKGIFKKNLQMLMGQIKKVKEINPRRACLLSNETKYSASSFPNYSVNVMCPALANSSAFYKGKPRHPE